MNDVIPDYLTWKDPGRALAVRISHDAISKLNVEIMRGFGVTRRRGTESGGILLGQMDGDVILIEGFEVVPCEYAFGPSYILSPNDKSIFAEAVERAGAAAIGFFRSHTRDGLTISQPDAEIFSVFFGAAGKVALIAKPFATRPPSASLYFPHAEGQLRPEEPAFEFQLSPRVDVVIAEPPRPPSLPPLPDAPPPAPLETDSTSREESASRYAPALAVPVRVTDSSAGPQTASGGGGFEAPPVPPASAPLPPPAPALVPPPAFTLREAPAKATPAEEDEVLPAEPGRAGAGFVTVVLSVLFTGMAMLTGFIAGFQLAGGQILLMPRFGLQPPDPAVSYQLRLRAEQAGDRIRVTWPSDSIAVRSASGGTLYITEAGNTSILNLQAHEVRFGTILHAPQASEVRFRIELNLPEQRTLSETVTWHR